MHNVTAIQPERLETSGFLCLLFEIGIHGNTTKITTKSIKRNQSIQNSDWVLKQHVYYHEKLHKQLWISYCRYKIVR